MFGHVVVLDSLRVRLHVTKHSVEPLHVDDLRLVRDALKCAHEHSHVNPRHESVRNRSQQAHEQLYELGRTL